MAATEKTIFSKTVRRMLGLSLHDWENVMLISLGAAAFAAVFVIVSTYAVVQLQRREASDAKANVEKAHANIAAANKAIAEANEQADQARAAIAIADERAAQAHERAAEANARALEARLALEKYKAHRRLSAQEQAEIASKVGTLKGVRFAISAAGTEPLHFGIDVARALVAGGLEWIDWPLDGNVTNLPHDRRTVGSIQLLGTVVRTFNPDLVGARDTIAAALTAPQFEGTNVEPATPASPGFPAVLIMIGVKR